VSREREKIFPVNFIQLCPTFPLHLAGRNGPQTLPPKGCGPDLWLAGPAAPAQDSLHQPGVVKKIFHAGSWQAGLEGALVAVLFGLFFVKFQQHGPLARFSFDFPHRYLEPADVSRVAIVKLDQGSYGNRKFKHEGGVWDRAAHAELVRKLTSDGAALIVFDTLFDRPQSAAETALSPGDQALASAIKAAGGRVVLAAMRRQVAQGNQAGIYQTIKPDVSFLEAAGGRCGISDLLPELDDARRRHQPENREDPTLPWIAVKTAAAQPGADGGQVTKDPAAGIIRRWIRYYGPAQTLVQWDFDRALEARAGEFTNKFVFIGKADKAPLLDAATDTSRTPFSRWTGVKSSNVEILATIFLNLWRGEWLNRMSLGKELALVLAAGAAFGFLFARMHPMPGLAAAAAGVVVISAIGIDLPWSQRVWFNWAAIALQVPVAWGCGLLFYTKVLAREKEAALEEKRRAQLELEMIEEMRKNPDEPPTERDDETETLIPDFKLLKRIGDGAYGDVWLARSRTDSYRAIKVVYERKIGAGSFDREFSGLREFERISREHPGWVQILHVGKAASNDFFYYVMEPADDLQRGAAIDPDSYIPWTLGKMLEARNRLPLAECAQLGISLTEALGELHRRELFHRDVKPSNIIFVKGAPKLADIGLVARIGASRSVVGTPNYMPRELTHNALDDIYGLGKVLYVAATGEGPQHYPAYPAEVGDWTDGKDLPRFMELINKSCEENAKRRFASAEALREALKQFAVSARKR